MDWDIYRAAVSILLVFQIYEICFKKIVHLDIRKLTGLRPDRMFCLLVLCLECPVPL